jgi:hypothetical protein
MTGIKYVYREGRSRLKIFPAIFYPETALGAVPGKTVRSFKRSK